MRGFGFKSWVPCLFVWLFEQVTIVPLSYYSSSKKLDYESQCISQGSYEMSFYIHVTRDDLCLLPQLWLS